MKLIGMLDSPYVRRVAVSLQLLGLRFEHEPLSVFSNFGEFAHINPVVKAPTLVCDSGVVLMDSSLILQWAEQQAGGRRSLVPRSQAALEHDLFVTGMALAACEKAVQIVYERQLRPVEKQHEPWVARVTAQLLAACGQLEAAIPSLSRPLEHELTQGQVTAAVGWHFVHAMLPGNVRSEDHPSLQAFGDHMESLSAFARAPHGAAKKSP